MHGRRVTSRHVRHQRGAALLTAMIIVTLVTTLASAMVWQQWRAVQVEAAERARTQSAWILAGALDFAQMILREDMKGSRTPVTALTEPWATPLAESRLSTFLAADKTNADDGPEAFLSGYITDAQARYNLRNLVSAGKTVPAEIEAFERLCQSLGIETGIASLIASALLDATATVAVPSAKLEPKTVAQLAWLGIDPSTVQTLQGYVVLLPIATKVNVNTASKEVLMAAMKGLDPSSAERLLQVRQRTPFSTIASVEREVPSLAQFGSAGIVVDSSFFEITGRLRLADHVLTERSLVQRLPNRQINVLVRDRVASLEQVGS